MRASPIRSMPALRRGIVAALVLVVVAGTAAFAAEVHPDAVLGTSVESPTVLTRGSNPFTIKLSATGALKSATAATVVTTYRMDAAGTITPGTETTPVTFAAHQYTQHCRAEPSTPGCRANPHEVTATLVVDNDVEPDTDGVLEIVVTGAKQLGVAKPQLRYVRVDAGPSLDLTTTVSPETIPAGAARVPIPDIPIDAIPLRSVSLGSAPLRSVDLDSTPLRSVPLRSVPLRSVPLRSVLLSSVPLEGGWDAILEGSDLAHLPLQSITLQDVLDDPVAGPRIDSTPLRSVDLSATPLRSVSIASIALGATPLRSVPLDPASTDPLADWRALLAELGFSTLAIDDNTTLFALDIAGVPLRSVPLRSVPLRSVSLVESAPLRSVPLRSVALAATPLRSVPLRSVAISVAPLRSVPLRSVSTDSSVWASIVDCSSEAVDCTTGDTTLGAAADADAILPTATLLDLNGEYGGTTIGDLAHNLPEVADLTLADVLMGILLASDYPWEDLPLDEMDIQGLSPSDAVTYRLDIDLRGGNETAPITATVQLPAGFRYAGGAVFGEQPDGEIGADDGPAPGGEIVEPDSMDGNGLTFVLGPVGTNFRGYLDVPAHPGLSLGTYAGSAAVSVAELGDEADLPDVTVTEHFEDDNDDPATAPELDEDTLYLSHVADEGDVDYFNIPVPAPGSRVSVLLSHLGNDNDLVVYSPVGPDAAPLRSVPLRSVPLRSVPVGDDQADGQTVVPETLQDIPLRSVPLRSVSANRSTEDETVDLVTTSTEGVSGGSYTIQVSGYNGSTSPDPYVLRVKVDPPADPPSCAASPLAGHQGTAASPPAGLSLSGRDTVFLVNEQRLEARFGSGGRAIIMNALAQFVADAGTSGVDAAVVPVDAYGSVRAAYDALDADPCDPMLANGAVEAILSVLRDLRGTDDTLENVVLVGDDEMLPMARVPDLTRLSNERDYTDAVSGAGGEHNALSAAFATGHVLSDDPYGDDDPVGWLDRTLFVPDLAVGRLVETPDEIAAQLGQFVAADGQLDPQSALVTGYDFLTDGANAVVAGLDELVGALTTLISETWTRTDVRFTLFPVGGLAPHIASINAHYDHYRLLPAIGNATGDESDLYTTADVRAQPAVAGQPPLLGRILFTMGCHAGLNVPDAYVAADRADDWAQTFAAQGAVYVANTGFGYGDTEAVALSEELMASFAGGLGDGTTVGSALVAAKQSYFGALGVYGVYDEKALMEPVLYGLPMYRVGDAPDAAGAAAQISNVTSTDEATGLDVADVTVTPDLERNDTARGTFFSVDGEVQVTHYRPIQPRTSVDVTNGDKVAHGALLTSLVSDDLAVDPVFARPTIDLAANEPEIATDDVVFPTYLHNISTFDGPDGPEQRLVLMPGQFFSDDDPTTTTGIQRLYGSMGAKVYYGSADAEFVPPTFHRVDSAVDNGAITFSVDVDDAAGTGAVSADDVKRVLVLFKDDSGTWKSLDLTRSDTSRTWAGIHSVEGVRAEFFVQAVDEAGNTAATTNKGVLFSALPALDEGAERPAPPTVQTTGERGTNGWFTGGVTVTVAGAEDVTYTINGRETDELAVSGDGTHLVDVRGSDGSRVVLAVSIDSTPPTVTVVRPVGGDEFHVGTVVPTGFTCADATSPVTCVGPRLVDTSSLGEHTATFSATDAAGNTALVTRDYTVVPPYTFDGFLPPLPRSVVNGGSTIPVKWRLSDANGQVTDLSAVSAVEVHAGTCSGGSEIVEVRLTAPSIPGLSHTLEHYEFKWATDRAWTSCRTLVIYLDDGTTHSITVNFS